MSPEHSEPEDARASHAFSDETLAPVYELNEQFLDMVARAARNSSWSGSSWQKALGVDTLSAQMRASLSRVPVCLVDLGLRHSSPDRFPDTNAGDAIPAFLAQERALELTRMTLTLAWTFARTDPCAASIVFALPAQDAKALIGCRVHRLSELADRLVYRIRPMWLGSPRVWAHLFTVSEVSASDRLPGMRVRLLQRQLADLMLAPPASGSPRAFQR
jgi:hypothetical protein